MNSVDEANQQHLIESILHYLPSLRRKIRFDCKYYCIESRYYSFEVDCKINDLDMHISSDYGLNLVVAGIKLTLNKEQKQRLKIILTKIRKAKGHAYNKSLFIQDKHGIKDFKSLYDKITLK
jgi:hypothetical protein